ncbi:MAG: CDP-alcohol phosphatidyltransferase family protein [Thermodesulfovibrionia bacterium]
MIIKNLPNILTMTRILLLPFFATSLIYNGYLYALIIFIMAGITDILDGYIARMKRQVSELGTILDPVADKFIIITSFILMTVNGIIPKWLTIVVISRDVIVITGVIILYFVINQMKVEPSILGKISNILQYLLIGLVLLTINIKGKPIIPNIYLILVAVFATISGIQYIYKGLKTVESEGA